MRSDFLVHWTGGADINAGIEDPALLSSAQVTSYLDRLASILSTGFWLSRPIEKVLGRGGAHVGFTTPTTCFTEIKLSQAQQHAKRYGFLGVAVERRFVLERFGGPVHYLRNHPHEKFVESYAQIGLHLQNPSASTQEVFDAMSYCASFLKAMSTHGTDDFSLLDEHEWRIVFTPELLTDGRAMKISPDKYSIPISVDEVKLIIFPNDSVRALWSGRNEHAAFVKDRLQLPVYLTLKECAQF